MEISIIVAKSQNNVIGKDNKLIWHLPADLAYFKKRTSNHHIIMGRKTHESIKKKLPNRENIIISRNEDYTPAEGCVLVDSLDKAIDLARGNNETEAFIVGGSQIYEAAIEMADKMYITEINAEFKGDIHFPEFNQDEWREISRFDCYKDEANPYDYSFVTYQKVKTK